MAKIKTVKQELEEFKVELNQRYKEQNRPEMSDAQMRAFQAAVLAGMLVHHTFIMRLSTFPDDLASAMLGLREQELEIMHATLAAETMDGLAKMMKRGDNEHSH